MAKLTLANVSNPENQTSLVNTINNNSDLIEAAIENTLSRDGSTPNTMEAPLDMNSNQILNLPLASSPTEPVRKGEFDLLQGALDDLNSAVDQAEAAQAAAEAAQAGAEAAEAGAQAAVEAAIDEFEDVYLGPKASDPLVDNDGDPLAEGMLYFNTVSNALKIYDGASWIAYSAATGITEVAEDTSPTLGGSLDGGGFDITNLDDLTCDDITCDNIAANVITVTDQAYNATTWNASLEVPTKNAVRDEMELKLAITTAASTYQPLDAGLTALAAFNTNGILAQTADNTFAGRTITGTANQISVSDGDGVSGNPTLALPATVAIATAIELSHASQNTLTASSGVLSIEGNPLIMAGRHTIWIPSGAMIPRTTNGAAAGLVEMTTNKNMFRTLDFDTTTQEFAQFEIHFPKSWNLGTVTFQPVWSHASTSTNFGVTWGLAGIARSDDDPGDVAFGTAQTSVDTGGTTNDIYIGPESSAITIGGSPATGDTVQFQINRTVSDAGDNMAIDARLHGIRLFYTVNAATDA